MKVPPEASRGRRFILISGSVSSGKTTLARALADRYGFRLVKTRELIHKELGPEVERRALQKAGAILDRKTKGVWVASALGKLVQTAADDQSIIVDAVRRESQILAVRRGFGARVTHIHLTAPTEVMAHRYSQRAGDVKELATYEAVQEDPTEKQVRKLERIADIVIDTARNSPEDVMVRVAGQLGLYGRSVERLVDVLIGGQYGSEGKGHVVSYLSPEYEWLLRVGGPNAGHKVFEETGPYTHHHLPSGTRFCESGLVIGPGATLYVPDLLKEIADCRVGADRLRIDPQAMIIEEDDRTFEKGGLVKSIGSTGQGVGAAVSRRVLRKSAKPSVRFARDEGQLKPFLAETREVLDRAFARGQRVLLEGTQGTGLSLFHGHYPYVTSRDTSASGCIAEAGIPSSRVRRIVMVCRTYPIRVESPAKGTSGPMNQELEWDEVSQRSGIPLEELREVEKTSTTKKKRRVSEFDWTLLRRAASLNGPTDVALTFADYVSIRNREARRFEQLTEETRNLIEEIERVAAAPVSLITTRFHSRSIVDRRAW